MVDFNFEHDVDRRGTHAIKWDRYGADVLPMWVADMEFAVPPQVIEAVQRRLQHPVFGYQADAPELRAIIAERMGARYGWQVDPDWIVILPGVVSALNMAVYGMTSPGDAVLMTPPIYPPFIHLSEHQNRQIHAVEMPFTREGHVLNYELDFDGLEAAAADARSRMFLFCNPHNPTGRVFTRAELERVADLCERHDLILCSDEIHCDVVYSGNQHIPVASLSPEIARRTVTLIAPSKTFNMPGMACSAAIVPDATLRARLRETAFGFGLLPNVFGYVAAAAAYSEGQPWVDALVQHLERNRDTVVEFVGAQMPGIHVTRPEGTFLAWMDCRELGIDNPYQYFLEHAKVALNDGAPFGAGGQGFVRLNFGCSHDMLMQALSQMAAQIQNGN
ncbi:MAG: PatB family C-S lyase [Anaerolineae bacterium]|nr:PatB family C-S lyase [Anaerolineae bacterium]